MPSRNNLRLASFDGSGIKGLSQLEVMTNIMHRLNWIHESNQSDGPRLPCDHFDLIGGSGTGGLIAILLGKLCMSVEEASEEFCKVIEQVYNSDGLTASERTASLRKCIEDIMKRKQLPIDLQLLAKQAGAGACFVVTSSRNNAKSTICLRSYPVRSQPPLSITIIDAVIATCAVQPDFAPITCGSGFRKREYIAANGAANPVNEVITEAHLLFGGDAKVASLLSLGTGNPGIISFPPTGSGPKLDRVMQDMMQDCERRAQEMEQRIGQVGIYCRLSVEQGMQSDQLEQMDDLSWIAAQTEDYLNRPDICEKLDLLVQNFGVEIGPISLDQLKHVGGQSVSNQITATLERSLEILISNQDDAVIAKLKPTSIECGSHVSECMQGTRQDILARVNAWVADVRTPNILWIKGYPGVGKSAIATSLVSQWQESGRVHSSFFFRRESADIMTPNALWRSIAYDFSRRDPTIRRHLVNALKTNDTLPQTSNIDDLFYQLVQQPLVASEESSDTPAIVVIDALDECGGLDGMYSDHRRGLMRTLKSWSSLPGRFRLVVTSRGEHDIEQLFSVTAHYHLEIHAGQKVDAASTEDIRTFLKQELRQIVARYSSLPPDWPGEETTDKMTEYAAGLFIWIKTFLKLLERGEPRRTLKQLLSRGGGGMASLYTWILNAYFPNPSEEDIEDFQAILGAIIFTKSPLDLTSLASLLSMDSTSMEYICNGLQSVLDCDDTLRIHHQSFVDFLVNPDECPPLFRISRERENQNLTMACLRTMETHLRFNICDLKSSYVRNSDIPNLTSQIEECIPTHLRYSSCYWAGHLVDTRPDNGVHKSLQDFMNNRFLFWLEVLSLVRQTNTGWGMLRVLIDWLQACDQDDSLARDMQEFIAAFASVISQSVPHIYLSALPFAPSNLSVSKEYKKSYQRTFSIHWGGLTSWPATQNLFTGHEGAITCVSFSRDGRRIVSCSEDHTIRVWDAETGETIIPPLEGHDEMVNAVSFSPDGRRIVSCSDDRTIRVWDAETGETVMGPLEGHQHCVTAITFSPNGRRIVSGSSDYTIRLWDAETGETVLGPLEGHTALVTSVSFSPDSRRVVSGSGDKTIRLWDAETGEMVIEPLNGHVNSVTSVSFSPDGKQILSGSYDTTIRVWDVETGKTVIGPLEGHTDVIYSTSFSPDGTRIASGSGDNTIRLWAAETGEMIATPLEGHVEGVYSVAFSPDGRRIVSGSDDNTIRVWDANIGETAIQPLQGHTDVVTSVSFSPDGRRIVSGSADNTVRLWDSQLGESVIEALKGLTGEVNCVSFSLNGEKVVSGSQDGVIRVWDAQTGEPMVGPLVGSDARVNSVSFFLDDCRVVSGSADGIRVWDTKTGEVVMGPLQVRGHWINSLCVSPDDKIIVSGADDKAIRMWDARTGAVINTLEGHTEAVQCVSFSPDYRLIASASSDFTIRLWGARTGNPMTRPLEGHTGWVTCVSFSPDSRRVVSGSGDNTVRVWDVESGKTVVGPLEGHLGWIRSVSFSPDGRYVASGSSDHTVRIWDTDPVDSMPHIYSIFQDSPNTKDGWILGSNSELLLWIPPELRPRLCPLRNTLAMGGMTMQLDLKDFVHGEAWIHCKDRVD